MTVKRETLAEFVGRIRREKGLSCADVERQSARGGQKIAASYVNRIENGLKNRPTADRLQALARGLGIPVDELWARASGSAPSDVGEVEERRLVTMFRELPRDRRRDLLNILESLHRDHRRSSAA